MNLLKRIQRALRRSRCTEKFAVWTRDAERRVFHYDIRIAAVADRSRYLVRFDRTGPQGNTMRVHRILREPEVTALRLRSC